MTELVTYINFNDNNNDYIPIEILINKYLPPIYKDQVYTFILCCKTLEFDIPKEIYMVILKLICLKKVYVNNDHLSVLQAIDDYITSPSIQSMEPHFILYRDPPKSGSESFGANHCIIDDENFNMLKLHTQMSFVAVNYTDDFIPNWKYKIYMNSYYYTKIFIGFIVNNKINNIIVSINGHVMDKSFYRKIKLNNLYNYDSKTAEHELDVIYVRLQNSLHKQLAIQFTALESFNKIQLLYCILDENKENMIYYDTTDNIELEIIS